MGPELPPLHDPEQGAQPHKVALRRGMEGTDGTVSDLGLSEQEVKAIAPASPHLGLQVINEQAQGQSVHWRVTSSWRRTL